VKKYLLILIFLICMFPFLNVYAVDKCTTEEMNRLKELANNVEFTYTNEIIEVEDEEGGFYEKNIYKISILNDNIDLKYKYRISGDSNQLEIDKEKFSSLNFYGGEKLVISIYAYTTNLCTGKSLKTKTLTLPHYNYFYRENEEVCKEYPDFKYCEEFMDTSDLTKEQFNLELEEYKDDLNKLLNNNNDSGFSIVDIVFATVALILIIIVIIAVIRYKKKDRDLWWKDIDIYYLLV